MTDVRNLLGLLIRITIKTNLSRRTTVTLSTLRDIVKSPVRCFRVVVFSVAEGFSNFYTCRALIVSWSATGPCSYASIVEEPAELAAVLLTSDLFPFELFLVVVATAGVLLAADVDVVVDVGLSDMARMKSTGKHSCEVSGNAYSPSLCLCFYRQKKA